MYNTRRFIVALFGSGALLAVPLLWSMAVAAKDVSCTVAQNQTDQVGLNTENHERYAVECQGEGLLVTSEARSNSDNTGIQVRLRFLTVGADGTATASGYSSSRVFIPGCIALDVTPGLSYSTTFCSAPVRFLTVSARATGS